MTPLQKLTIRASEIRARLATIAADELTDETSAELETLRNEYTDVETRSAALQLVEGDEPPVETTDTPEARELRTVLGNASIGESYDPAFEARSTTGATAEAQQHYGLGGNQVPLAMLRSDTDEDLETRAATEAPSDVPQVANGIVPWVFPDSAAAFMSIPMPTVGVGEQVYSVLTKQLDVRTPAEAASAAETTGTFSADVLTPSRIQASFEFSREDRARFAGMSEALRQNLSEGLSDGLDQQILNGTNGLLNGTVLANNNVTAVTAFNDYIANYAYGRVDGRYASTTSDLRILMGAGTYAHAGNVYRNNSVDRTALDWLMELTAGVRVSAHVPAVASNKQNSVIRLGSRMDALAPIWEGVTMIPDEITGAKTGTIKITAVMLSAQKVIRAAGFRNQQSQHA